MIQKQCHQTLPILHYRYEGETNFTKKMSITQVTIKHHWRILVTILQVLKNQLWEDSHHWTAEIKNKLQREQLANTDGLPMICFIWSFKLYKVSICSTLSAHHKTVDESVGLPSAHSTSNSNLIRHTKNHCTLHYQHLGG